MSTRATIPRSLRRARRKTGTTPMIARATAAAHRRDRAAWRRWIRLGDDAREPTPAPLDSRDIA